MMFVETDDLAEFPEDDKATGEARPRAGEIRVVIG
jgi:hypothetical protein